MKSHGNWMCHLEPFTAGSQTANLLFIVLAALCVSRKDDLKAFLAVRRDAN